jgi:gliding motility-associated-like protein
MVKSLLIAVLLLVSVKGWSQTFPETGQLPSTAFPVCGTNTFKQTIVPEGTTGGLQVPGCGLYPDVNPFWYSFTCFQGGTLGFVITPRNLNDDYDWMLFDITGHNPSDVFTNASLVVVGNWSGSSGLTGARAGGSNKTECGSDPKDNIPTFSAMPTLIQGHKYLLIVSHYTQSQTGYSLTFSGGTAVITDPTLPHLQSATIACDRKTISVVLNKQMRCNSLATDGSDFSVATATISSAQSQDCNSGFDMTSLLLTLQSPLAPGNYSLVIKNGTDGNTLLDDCGTDVPVDESVSFTVLPPHATPFDSLTTPSCAPQIVQLVFSDPIQCSSIAADGSDFQISGGSDISISKVEGQCTGGLTSAINITFNAPIVKQGNFLISLVTGSDGNSLINLCGVETPPGGQLSFYTKDTVSASFDYNILFGCKTDTISLNYELANQVNYWQWTIDSTESSTTLDPEMMENTFGQKTVQHIVSNGFCSDTSTQIVNLDNSLKALFQAPEHVCPKDVLVFVNNTVGNVVSWNWDFGDGTSSAVKDPTPHVFPDTWAGKTYRVSLIVENNLGCFDSLSEEITKLQSCYITVPNAFTPNGDGKNDFLYPLNAYSATNLEFRVFNRYGQLVFETKDWTHKWDGTIDGKPQPIGTYVWTLRYTDESSGRVFSTRGTSVLIR